MSTSFYRQCKLARKNETQVSYIPEKYAILNKILKLKNHHGVWENGWKVEFVGARMEDSEVPDVHKQIRQHRKNTGDADR